MHTISLNIWRFGLFYFLTLYLSLLLAVLLLYWQYKLSCEVVLHLSDAVFVGVQLVTSWLRGKLMICSGFVLYNARLMDWIKELSHHDGWLRGCTNINDFLFLFPFQTCYTWFKTVVGIKSGWKIDSHPLIRSVSDAVRLGCSHG